MSLITDLWLKTHGQEVQATVTSVGGTANIFHESKGLYAGNPNVAANAYIVTAEWIDPQTNTAYIFEKRSLADHPPHVKEGQTVLVRIDPNNPQHYSMEIE